MSGVFVGYDAETIAALWTTHENIAVHQITADSL